MIEIEKVVRCPVVKATMGLIEIAPEVIRMLAGAVEDRDEWMTIGLGERRENGLHVIINSIWTPPKQYRQSAHVRPYKNDEPEPEEMFPDWVLENMVCGIHSHNTMNARFSGSFSSKDGGDLSREGICSSFASNIVIATPRQNDLEARMLGFEYEAILNHEMECGEMGVSYAKLMPLGAEGWPFNHKIIRPSITTRLESLGDCPNVLRYKTGTYSVKDVASCGLETTPGYKSYAFGKDGAPILSELPPAARYTSSVSKPIYTANGREVDVSGYWKKREEEKEREAVHTRVTDDLGDYTNEEWYQAYIEFMDGRS